MISYLENGRQWVGLCNLAGGYVSFGAGVKQKSILGLLPFFQVLSVKSMLIMQFFMCIQNTALQTCWSNHLNLKVKKKLLFFFLPSGTAGQKCSNSTHCGFNGLIAICNVCATALCALLFGLWFNDLVLNVSLNYHHKLLGKTRWKWAVSQNVSQL